MQQTEVIGTVRKPDGQPSGDIEGLVIKQQSHGGGWLIISNDEAIKMAKHQLLWCKSPYGSVPPSAWIEPIDRDGDGYYDYVRTVPDATQQNNLLALPIWDRVRSRWVEPRFGAPTGAPAVM